MRCKDMKAEIKRQQKEINSLKQYLARPLAERTYDWNLLEIVVRPRRGAHLFGYEFAEIDLRVCGSPELDVPDRRAGRTISLTAIDFIERDWEHFTKRIADIMTIELLGRIRT